MGFRGSGRITKTVSEIGKSRLGKMLDFSNNNGNETPYLGNINVRWFSFDLKEIKNIRVSEREKSLLALEPGDVLVCEGGEPGRCAIWSEENTNIIFQKALHRVRLNTVCLPVWFAFNLKVSADSGRLTDYFTGTTIKHLTGESLQKVKIKIPSLDEQKEIVLQVHLIFKKFSEIEKYYENCLDRYNLMSPSVLSMAFCGKL